MTANLDDHELTIKMLNLKNFIRNPLLNSKGYKVHLVDHEEMLLISSKEVIWMKGGLTLRKLRYEEESIINLTFANFNSEGRCLVVALLELAHVYFPDGKKQIISFPFNVKNIFPYVNGILIERESSKSLNFNHVLSHNGSLNSFLDFNTFDPSGFNAMGSLTASNLASDIGATATTNTTATATSATTSTTISSGATTKSGSQVHFLTLSEPLGEFGTVVSSSTSSISRNETLVLFPELPRERLALTYDTTDHMISIYNVRVLSKNNSHYSSSKRRPHLNSTSSRSMRRPSSMKKPSTSLATPMKVNDESVELATLSTIGLLNYDKLRMVSETLSIDRMASSAETVGDFVKPLTPFETTALRKDVIMTKLESIPVGKNERKYLSFYSSYYHNQQCIILNNSKTCRTSIMIFKESNSMGMTLLENYQIPCLSCIPLSSSCGYDGILAILKDNQNMCLCNPFISLISLNIELDQQYNALSSSYGSQLTLTTLNDGFQTISLLINPKSKLIAKIFESLKYMSNSFSYQYFWMQWSAALSLVDDHNEWDAFVVTLLSVIISEDNHFDENRLSLNKITKLVPLAKALKFKSEIKYSLKELSSKIVLTLHLIREDMKLDLRKSKNVENLGLLLSQLTLWMGWSQLWSEYYGTNPSELDKATRFLTLETVQIPLNLLASLASLFSDDRIVPYLTFSQISSESESVDALITPRTYRVLRLFEVMVSENFGAVDVVNLMIEFDIKFDDLDTYPVSISVPLKESILVCQLETPLPWSELALELVGRKDILRFLHTTDPKLKGPRTSGVGSSTGARDINRVLSSYEDSEVSAPWDGQAEADRINVTKLIFSNDRRFLEITTLLQSSRVPTINPCFTQDIFENEYDKEYLFHKTVAMITALRTLTIPLGRGALFLSSRLPLMTERFPIPKLNFNCMIPNSDQTLSLDKDSIDPQVIQWGFFHNGASSGLTISRDAKDITGGWVAFNQPPSFNAQHGGFLLGLGLNGHLKKLDQWHIYNYLGPKHTYTSIGLLLGMAASLKGTMDLTLTKVLSVHVVALLPFGATDLKVSLSVQTAGLVGIGLLYLETQHHRMSEILLSQIHSKLSYEDELIVDEGYRLAAGIGLGYINLGKGDDVKGLNDTHLVEELVTMASSMKDVQTDDEYDKSSSGAILALTFIYLKTNNEVVANKLELPQTEQLLDYIRPDLLLLRCLGRNLIMWNEIHGTKEWVESQIPECLSAVYSVSSITALSSNQLSYYNTLGGACLALALRYASSMDRNVMNVVLWYLEEMIRITELPIATHDQKLTLTGAAAVRDVLAISCSIIMAGSGNLDIFRRLRVLYGRIEPRTTYGNFMAINMALGFLFVGGGQYAFAKTNFAIASLITSVYPLFPTLVHNSAPGTDCHLQALRHFWALSVEPRCLIVRDVETSEPQKIPVRVKLSNGTTAHVVCPKMIPSLDEIVSIETLSDDHLKLNYDFSRNDQYYDIFAKSLTLYVYKKKVQNSKRSFNAILNKIENEKQAKEVIHPLTDSLIYKSLHESERKLLFNVSKPVPSSVKSPMDDVQKIKSQLTEMARSPKSLDDLWNLKILFKFCDNFIDADLHYLGIDFIESLKSDIWKHTREVN